MQLDGVLFFPVTPFDADGAVAADVLATHVEERLAHAPGAVFVACGTGEFHALSTDEVEVAVSAAVKTVAGQVPVVAGTGGTLPQAVDCARRAAAAGADALLLLPPYLLAGPPEGLVRYVTAVAEASDLPVIVYQRAGAVFTPEAAATVAALPGVIGFKDGLGDFDRMQRIVPAVRAAGGPGFLLFNGLPTAELTAPAYRAIGVPLYSSAAFCFAPEVATAFHWSLYAGDGHLAERLLDGFYRPLVELRDRVPGYAVALVKAGTRLRGLPAGGVRPPLVDPTEEHVAALQRILETGLRLVADEA